MFVYLKVGMGIGMPAQTVFWQIGHKDFDCPVGGSQVEWVEQDDDRTNREEFVFADCIGKFLLHGHLIGFGGLVEDVFVVVK